MTYTLTHQNGTTQITMSFFDEGVPLQGHILIKGDASAAIAYVPVFEADLRKNFAEMFPVPEVEEHEGEDGDPE